MAKVSIIYKPHPGTIVLEQLDVSASTYVNKPRVKGWKTKNIASLSAGQSVDYDLRIIHELKDKLIDMEYLIIRPTGTHLTPPPRFPSVIDYAIKNSSDVGVLYLTRVKPQGFPIGKKATVVGVDFVDSNSYKDTYLGVDAQDVMHYGVVP